MNFNKKKFPKRIKNKYKDDTAYTKVLNSIKLYLMFIIFIINKLLEQGYVKERLKSSLRKFYDRYGDLQYEVSLTHMLNDILWPDQIQ